MLSLVELQFLLCGSFFMSQCPHLCLQLDDPDDRLCAQLLLASLGAAEVVL